VAANVVSTPRIESLKVVEKSAMIAVPTSDDCSSLQVRGAEADGDRVDLGADGQESEPGLSAC